MPASDMQLHVYSAFWDCFNSLEIAQVPDLHGTYKSNNSPSHAILMASFPAAGCSHLSFWIFVICKHEGEGLGDSVTCGYIRQTESRHMGTVPNERILKHFLVMSVWGWRTRAFTKQSFITHVPGMGQREMENYYRGTPPPMSTQHYYMWPSLSGLHLPICILQVLKDWR